MKKSILLSILLTFLTLSNAYAESWKWKYSKIKRIDIWPHAAETNNKYGIRVLLQDGVGGCYQFYIKGDAARKEMTQSMLLAAKTTGATVGIQYKTTENNISLGGDKNLCLINNLVL